MTSYSVFVLSYYPTSTRRLHNEPREGFMQVADGVQANNKEEALEKAIDDHKELIYELTGGSGVNDFLVVPETRMHEVVVEHGEIGEFTRY